MRYDGLKSANTSCRVACVTAPERQPGRTSSGGLCMEVLEAFYDDRKLPIPPALEEAFSGVDVDDDGCLITIALDMLYHFVTPRSEIFKI